VTRVVFNADDLGVSPSANEGIARAVRAGIVREVSLCVTGSAVEHALATLDALEPRPGVGLHFSLTLGRALSGKLRGLSDGDGAFSTLPGAIAACTARVPDALEIQRELRAQLDRLAELGIVATHLNAHHHVHVLPVVRDAVLAVLAELSPLHVRVPAESLATSKRVSLRRVMLSLHSRAFLGRAERELPSFRRLAFVGMDVAAARDHARAFERVASRLGPEPAEWIVHPDLGDASAHGGGGLARAARPDEIETLTRPETRELLEAHGVVPSRYRELV
jgi:chitin disaccharide deacetylase